MASSSLSSNVIISSIIEMTLMIGRSGIIQRVDHRPSVTSFWTSRFFALSIIHQDHVHLSADFTEMLLTHWSRDRRTLHLSLRVHDHSRVVLEVDGDVLLPVPRLPLTDHHRPSSRSTYTWCQASSLESCSSGLRCSSRS